MQLSQNKGELSYLVEAFPSVDFRLYQSDDPDHFISCFIAIFPDADFHADAWLEITSLIAVNFQSSLRNDFATWNIYLGLVFSKPISRHLKYKIESNRFALRKMVLTLKYGDVTEDQIKNIIENMILGNDLKLSTVPSNSIPYSGSSFVREFISHTLAIPSDAKEGSILTRRKHIAELLDRIPTL